jgi:XRE family aerobic/anaerobic benzoate catabolism transcriptional regulator
MTVDTHFRPILPQPAPVADDVFLRFLGSRVRELRSRRGMTRKMVARESDVSERHLAQLELGEGNVSIILLRRIANALNVSLIDLFAPDSPQSPPSEHKLLIETLLQRIPPDRLPELAERLAQDFVTRDKARRSRIALIGLRGAGKSTLGAMLSQEMKIPFIELDSEIEKDAGMALPEIFSLYGQTGYRRIEKRVLDRVLREGDRVIISIGGGVVSEKETYDQLLASCFTVWIKAHPEDHMARVIAQGDFRAMAENDEAMEDLRQILEAREPLYRRADLHLETSDESAGQSFSKLMQALQAALA